MKNYICHLVYKTTGTLNFIRIIVCVYLTKSASVGGLISYIFRFLIRATISRFKNDDKWNIMTTLVSCRF